MGVSPFFNFAKIREKGGCGLRAGSPRRCDSPYPSVNIRTLECYHIFLFFYHDIACIGFANCSRSTSVVRYHGAVRCGRPPLPGSVFHGVCIPHIRGWSLGTALTAVATCLCSHARVRWLACGRGRVLYSTFPLLGWGIRDADKGLMVSSASPFTSQTF